MTSSLSPVIPGSETWALNQIRMAQEGLRAARELAGLPPMPRIVCLCGSTRFKEQINAANARLTLEGNLVISLGVFGHADMPDHDWSTGGSELKRMLDELHKRKIDLADEIFVVNPGGYIGESTRSEIEYAQMTGRPVEYLEGGAA